MSSLRIGMLSALFNAVSLVSGTIPGTQLVLNKDLFKEERGGRKYHEPSLPALSQVKARHVHR